MRFVSLRLVLVAFLATSLVGLEARSDERNSSQCTFFMDLDPGGQYGVVLGLTTGMRVSQAAVMEAKKAVEKENPSEVVATVILGNVFEILERQESIIRVGLEEFVTRLKTYCRSRAESRVAGDLVMATYWVLREMRPDLFSQGNPKR
ncbi:MAG: hypothetical protein JRH10_05835 [Deltaproteobacteria bacterium]|nr:hypothetical protein [Deltaproteobacteria bacterium]